MKRTDSLIRLDIALQRDEHSGTIRGRLLHDGAPVAGVTVGLDLVES